MKFIKEDFYPTPEELLEKITEGVKWSEIKYALEPSAGSGNIVDFIEKKRKEHYGREIDVDCIEIDPDLIALLKGKEYKVIHNDFLTFKTFKQYDLIFMNPPFSTGCKHLLKALELQEDGGDIICILNAETIRNPYSNERQDLVNKLGKLNASIEYMQETFKDAERETDVEIAVVKVHQEQKEKESYFYESLKQKAYAEHCSGEHVTDVVSGDYIKAAVAMYNMEVEAGIRLIEEYKALVPRMYSSLQDVAYNFPILELKFNGSSHTLSVNRYVKLTRRKYWRALFENPKFTKGMTSDLVKEYRDQVQKLGDYDFSEYNIAVIQIEMSKNLTRGVEDCIIKLFDELSYQHAYDNELSGNIHYYNGWKTNKSWIINSKVIIPWMNMYNTYLGKFSNEYKVREKLSDIEKALAYLDGGRTPYISLSDTLEAAVREEKSKKIEFRFFYATFYKKGTCHIEFKDMELLKKLNIFGSQQKRWLPPSYGKATYTEMTPEEQLVINEFEGEASYNNTMLNRDYFIYNPADAIAKLDVNAA